MTGRPAQLCGAPPPVEPYLVGEAEDGRRPLGNGGGLDPTEAGPFVGADRGHHQHPRPSDDHVPDQVSEGASRGQIAFEIVQPDHRGPHGLGRLEGGRQVRPTLGIRDEQTVGRACLTQCLERRTRLSRGRVPDQQDEPPRGQGRLDLGALVPWDECGERVTARAMDAYD